jgi:hypothetical protein
MGNEGKKGRTSSGRSHYRYCLSLCHDSCSRMQFRARTRLLAVDWRPEIVALRYTHKSERCTQPAGVCAIALAWPIPPERSLESRDLLPGRSLRSRLQWPFPVTQE